MDQMTSVYGTTEARRLPLLPTASASEQHTALISFGVARPPSKFLHFTAPQRLPVELYYAVDPDSIRIIPTFRITAFRNDPQSEKWDSAPS